MKRIVAVFALTIFLSFVVSPLNATETRIVWDFLGVWEEINIKIEAPFQAYPNDTMTIRIRVEAREDLQDVTVHFKIYGSECGGNITWFRRLEALTDRDLLRSGTVEDQYFDVDIPDDVDPGLLHGHVSCSWKVQRESSWQEQSIDDVCVHRMTYLRNKPYEELQVAYNQLLADYNQLLADYDSLQISFDYLENSHSDLQANHSTLMMDHSELLAGYNNLQEDYDSLNSTYNSLFSDYSSLQGKFNELKSKYEFGGEMANTLNLTYVFIETTV
ncbi:MAG: hypothetical protein ACFFDP_09680, partial [Promethearchaeota archaeon]